MAHHIDEFIVNPKNNMSHPAKARITREDWVSLDHVKNLPYLKHVELTKYAPRHFGLEKWTRPFVIPDNWMRKIYKDEVWRDTELPEHNSEPITKEQKQLLHEWLYYHSPIKNDRPVPLETRRSRASLLQYDDLIELLNIPSEYESEEECDIKKASSLDRGKPINKSSKDTGTRIRVCYGHKIQPESVIFEQAIEKMERLSPKEEAEFNTCINDAEFMKFLSDNIANLLGINKTN